jgi:hypothetical protein
MQDIRLECWFDGEQKIVEVAKVTGTGPDAAYHIHINRYYQGRIWITGPNSFQHDINPKSELTTEDIYIIIDLINQQYDTKLYTRIDY